MNPMEHNIVIDEDKCTGCCECLEFCQVDAIALNKEEGVIEVVDLEICIECHMCQQHCPQHAIMVYPQLEDSMNEMMR